jgi:uncharacterized protein involved in type VI secretion and phage assembly
LITGLTASAARDRSYELTFTAIPYSERYSFRPARIAKPVMAGTLPARVTSTTANDIYAHIDKDGRYRVNLDFDRGLEAGLREPVGAAVPPLCRGYVRPAPAAAGGHGGQHCV